MSARSLQTLSAILLFAFVQLGVATENWPQFRGRNASGASPRSAPVHWNTETQSNILWTASIPGLAHSSPIVWQDRVYVQTAVKPGDADLKVGLYGEIDPVDEPEAHRWRLIALDRSNGQIVWDTLALERVPRVKRHTKSTHCNSTPATDGQYIAALFGSEGLFCFNLKGELLWSKDLGPMDSGYYLVKTAQWGFASSPVIHDGKVIVQCDVQESSFLAAINLADGAEVWKTPREDVPTWSTPTIARTAERTQIIVNGWHHSGGYDFDSGTELWRLSEGGDIPVPTPIIGEAMVYLTSAHGRFRPMRAIRLDAVGNITPDEVGATNRFIAWAHPRKGNYMQTPILVGAQLFGCSDNGVLTCFDARTGDIHYEERLGRGREGFTASVVAASTNLYVTSETGTVLVVAAAAEFSVLATNDLRETCLATPAISDGTLFFRTRNRLLAIGAVAQTTQSRSR